MSIEYLELRNIAGRVVDVKDAVKELHNHFMLPHKYPTFLNTIDGWTVIKSNNPVSPISYSREVTLTGSTMTIFLPLNRKFVKLNRIGMFFNSANARTFNIRVYNAASITYYNTLASQTGHTAISELMEFGTEHKYIPHKIEFNFSSYTASDIVNIEVQVDEL